MGFLKKALAVISAPVTVPLKVASNIADNAGIGGPVSSLSSLASAPFELLQKGGNFKDVLNQAKPGLQILSTASGGALGTGLGLDSGTMARFLASDVPPMQEGPPVPTSSYVYSEPSSAKPNILPYAIAGGAALIAIILIARR